MRKVIAFKAFNGRLFESQQECYEYEQELAQYPKVNRQEYHARPVQLDDGRKVPVDIYKYVTDIQERPNQRRTEIYYIVGSKYRFEGATVDLDIDLMTGNLKLGEFSTDDWRKAARFFAERIIKGENLNDKTIKSYVTRINLLNRKVRELPCKTDLCVKVISRDKKWEISNPAWRTGIIAPYIFSIELV